MSNTVNHTSGSSNNHTDPELDHSSVTEQLNTAFVEQQPSVIEDARLGSSLITKSSTFEAQMADDEWMASKQLSKPVVVGQYKWSINNSAETIISELQYPTLLKDYDTIQRRTLQMYSFFRASIVFRILVNGTKFHSGQLIASWDPFSQASTGNYVYRYYNRFYATGLPNVLVNASSNEPVEIRIPYVHPRSFITTNTNNSFDVLGKLRLSVLNRLRAASGSSESLSVTIWMYAEEASVHVPIYDHNLLTNDEVEEAVPTSLKLPSSFGNMLSGNIPGLSSAVSSVATALGLDYPTDPAPAQSHINPLGSMSVAKGVDHSFKFSLDPRNGHVPSEDQRGTVKEECDIDVIKKIPMIIQVVEWNDSQTPGTILSYYPVTPNVCGRLRKDVGTPAIPLYLYRSANTYLSFLSNMYSFWRGSMRFRFDMVSTQFHTGRIMVAFIPNWFTTTPTLEQASSCPNAIIDLQQSSTCTISIPFVSSTVMKRTQVTNNSNDDDTVIGFVYVFVLNQLVLPSNVSSAIEYNVYLSGGDDFEFLCPRANGLQVYPIPQATPPPEEVEMAIPTCCQGDDKCGSAYFQMLEEDADFELAIPTCVLAENKYGDRYRRPEDAWMYDSESEDDDEDEVEVAVPTSGAERMSTRTGDQGTVTDVPISFGSDIIVPVDHFGEKFPLLDLIKRFSQVSRVVINQDAQYFTLSQAPIPYEVGRTTVPTVPAGVTQLSALFSVCEMFACWFGSLRYKISTKVGRTTESQMTVTYNPLDPSNFDGYYSGSGNPIQRVNLAQNNAMEIDVPCYTSFNLLLLHEAQGIGTVSDRIYDAGSIRATFASLPDQTVVDVYQAAGDDFRPFYLITPPADFNTDTNDYYHYHINDY